MLMQRFWGLFKRWRVIYLVVCILFVGSGIARELVSMADNAC
jgi:hypothetical protein